MANMLDYLRWRGDLSLSADPLNDIDSLVLAELSYVSFGECLPGGKARTVGEAARALLALDPEGKRIHQTGYLWEGNRALLALLPECTRFSGLPILNYTSILSEDEQQQFGAMTFALPGGAALVAFRGTDDSLVGWKEDLNLSFESPVPSQKQAARYLARAAKAVSGLITVCGHSKGGNLAVYAGACVPEKVQERIESVISFDGPGQDERVIDSPAMRAFARGSGCTSPTFRSSACCWSRKSVTRWSKATKGHHAAQRVLLAGGGTALYGKAGAERGKPGGQPHPAQVAEGAFAGGPARL